MLDFRHLTFLTLCSCGSFTKAADQLHITQPAVSQHIRYLEESYDCKLFEPVKRPLRLTPQGELLKEYAMTVFSDTRHLKDHLASLETAPLQFSFGATLSIGEYVMPNILSRLLGRFPDMKFSMAVANTQVLLNRLNRGELDFILAEGLLDKSKYDTTLFSLEPFIPVCSAQSRFAAGLSDFRELAGSRLILREKGSGTREILENILQERNYSLQTFEKIIEVGNMAALKQLVAEDLGITFLFEAAARKELEQGSLAILPIPGFLEQREFNFVIVKDSFFRSRSLKIFELLKQTFTEISAS